MLNAPTIFRSDFVKGRGLLVFMVALLSSAVGCEEKSQWDRVPLRGTAKLDGTPFSGSISMRPEAGVAGPAATANVEKGEFAFTTQTGPVRGAHAVILMPFKTSRDQVSVHSTAEVPSEPPFEVDIVAESPVKPTVSSDAAQEPGKTDGTTDK